MHGFEDEPARQRRAFFLHESGHAVVGRHYDFTIKELRCDGADDNYCDYDVTRQYQENIATLNEARSDPSVAAPELFAMALEAFEPRYVTVLGGLAGESLDLGRPLPSLARGVDDLASLTLSFTQIIWKFPQQEKTARLVEAIRYMSDRAYDLAKHYRVQIEALADALEAKSPLSGAEVEEVLKGVKTDE